MSLPRLLAGVRRTLPLSLDEHRRVHGPERGTSGDLLEDVARSGLRGRGGAAFPTAVKMEEVARGRGPRALLVNAAEGEPMSAKDGALLQLNPQLVLDGALAAADAVRARSITIAVPDTAASTRSALRQAIAERSSARRFEFVAVPSAHLAGEESALINYLNGGPLLPTVVPPFPAVRGLKRRPTLVQNPETLAHVALIARHGPDWFRSVGTPEHSGSALATVGGAVRHSGVYEIACGVPLRSLLDTAGGTLEPLRAVLVGGYHGFWIDAGDVDLVTLDDLSLTRLGGGLGAGVIVALGRSSCAVQEVARALGWLSSESAGQCGPCSNGLPALTGLLGLFASGRAPVDAWELLERWTGQVVGRGACRLPDGAVRFLRSALSVFGEEFAAHARSGPCAACGRPLTLRFALEDMPAARAVA
jgi:NADH:ubiquinone oxidoreductase subunit F (NADH-binding)